jgi:hypothetical protein
MAAKSDNGGCGLLILAGIVIFAISRCGGSETETDAAPSESYLSTLSAQHGQQTSLTMYIQSRKVNCRAEPAPQSAVVMKFEYGDAVDTGEGENGWLAVGNGGEDRCWIKASLLGEEKPEPVAISVPAPVAPTRLFEAPAKRSSLSCGGKSVCRQMDSCDQAYHYLNQCGVGRLDGDGDGVPCESIC